MCNAKTSEAPAHESRDARGNKGLAKVAGVCGPALHIIDISKWVR